MIHVDDVPGIVQCIGTFIHNVDILVILQHIRHHLQGIEIVHRYGRCRKFLLHLLGIHLLHGVDAVHPCLPATDVERLHLAEHQIQGRGNVAYYRCLDFTVTVHLFGTDIQLDELHVRIPLLAFAVIQQPVEPCTHQHHHIRLTESQATGRSRTQRMVIGQYTLRHRHRKERNAGLLHKLLQRPFCLSVCRPLTDDNQRFGSIAQQLQGTLHGRRTRQL